jgi:hypothetical protein
MESTSLQLNKPEMRCSSGEVSLKMISPTDLLSGGGDKVSSYNWILAAKVAGSMPLPDEYARTKSQFAGCTSTEVVARASEDIVTWFVPTGTYSLPELQILAP